MPVLLTVNNYSSPLPQQPVGPNSSLPFQSLPQCPLTNTNPFYLKFIFGNIRMCQGRRRTLRTADGMIPPPPYDLTIARAERHSFRDTAGNLITPGKETSYYHCRIDLIVQAQQEYRGDSWLKYDSLSQESVKSSTYKMGRYRQHVMEQSLLGQEQQCGIL